MRGSRQSARLGAYLYVFLREAARGKEWVTSEEVARLTGINSSHVRRDLLREVGSAGKRGVGYRAARMIQALAGHDITGAALLLAGSPLALTEPGAPFLYDEGIVRLGVRAAELEAAIAKAARRRVLD